MLKQYMLMYCLASVSRGELRLCTVTKHPTKAPACCRESLPDHVNFYKSTIQAPDLDMSSVNYLE